MNTQDLAKCPLDLVRTLWGGFLGLGPCPDLDLVTMDPLPRGQTLNLVPSVSTWDGFPALGTLPGLDLMTGIICHVDQAFVSGPTL